MATVAIVVVKSQIPLPPLPIAQPFPYGVPNPPHVPFGVKESVTLGPNQKSVMRYAKEDFINESSTWLLILASVGYKIVGHCRIRFHPTDPCKDDIFYFNTRSSVVIQGAQYICGNRYVKITSHAPTAETILLAPFILLGNFTQLNVNVLLAFWDTKMLHPNFQSKTNCAEIVRVPCVFRNSEQ